MSFETSLLGRIRKAWGSGYIIFPGAAVVLESADGVLLVRRAYDGRWQVPAGYSEEQESITETALRECREELGIVPRDLACFGLATSPQGFTQVYPNGDVVHSYVTCFCATGWDGEARPLDGENLEAGVFPLAAVPDTISLSTRLVLQAYGAFRRSGVFQML